MVYNEIDGHARTSSSSSCARRSCLVHSSSKGLNFSANCRRPDDAHTLLYHRAILLYGYKVKIWNYAEDSLGFNEKRSTMQNEQIVYWVSNDVPLNGRIELAGKGSGLHNIVIADWTICTNLAWVRSEFSILFLFFFCNSAGIWINDQFEYERHVYGWKAPKIKMSIFIHSECVI